MVRLENPLQLIDCVRIGVEVVVISCVHTEGSSVLFLADFVDWLCLTHLLLGHLHLVPYFLGHVSSDCRVWIVGDTVQSLQVSTKWSSAFDSWWEDAFTRSSHWATRNVLWCTEFWCEIWVRLFIKLVNPSRIILIIFYCCSTKVSSFIADNWDWFDVW